MSYEQSKIGLFISHAEEDDETLAIPLVKYLNELGVEVWYAKQSVLYSESIYSEIKKAIRSTPIHVSIISEAFFKRNWTILELGMFLGQEKGMLIPIFYNIKSEDVAKKLPFLADLNGIHLKNGENIKDAAKKILGVIQLKKEREEIKFEGQNINRQNKNELPTIEPFDTSNKNYKILILPFLDPDRDYKKTSLGRNLSDGLTIKNSMNDLGLMIKYLSSHSGEISAEEAKKLGEELKADMVIWGNDSKPEGMLWHHIYFHYVSTSKVVDTDKIPLEGRTGRLKTDRLIEITYGNLHLEIEDLVFWFLGNKFLLGGDFKKALINFEKLRNDKYLNDDLYFYKSYCFSKLDLLEEAEAALLATLNINPAHVRALHNYAVLLIEKNSDEARMYIEKALKIEPKNENSHFVYANFLKNYFGEFEKAEEHYLIAIEINRFDFEAHINYGILLATNLNKREKAKKHFEIALSINLLSAPAHYNYAAFFLGEGSQFRDKARKHFKIALQLDPNAAITHNHYGILLERQFNKYEEAINHYEEAVRLNPKYIHALQNLALLFWKKLDNPIKAKEYWEAIFKIDSNLASRHYNYAIFLESQKDYDNARVHYETALKIDSNLADANFNYARLILLFFAEKELAEKYYLKAIELDPTLKNEKMEILLRKK